MLSIRCQRRTDFTKELVLRGLYPTTPTAVRRKFDAVIESLQQSLYGLRASEVMICVEKILDVVG